MSQLSAQAAGVLRNRRSRAYLDVLARLDAGTHQADGRAVKDVLSAIEAEFPDLAVDEFPLGIVSRCYLGPPYVVHICNLDAEIVEHFESTRSMPLPYEKARKLALHSAYLYIEIYSDRLRAIGPDGSVSVIEG